MRTTSILSLGLVAIMTGLAHGQIYLDNTQSNSVLEYSPSGTLERTLAGGLNNPQGIAQIDNDLFVTSWAGGGSTSSFVSEYNIATGALITSSYITGLNAATGTAAYGDDLFIANDNGQNVLEYDVSGATPTLVRTYSSGMSYPSSVVATGGYLFVTEPGTGYVNIYYTTGPNAGQIYEAFNSGAGNELSSIVVEGNIMFFTSNGLVREYNWVTQTMINSNFITDLPSANSMMYDAADNSLIVNSTTSDSSGQLREYDLTGAAAGTYASESTIATGLHEDKGLYVAGSISSTPEPASWAFAAAVLALMVGLRCRERFALAV